MKKKATPQEKARQVQKRGKEIDEDRPLPATVTMSFRTSSSEYERADRFEALTGIEKSQLIRMGMTAILDEFDKNGDKITLPIKVKFE